MTKQESLDKIIDKLSDLKATDIRYIITGLELELLTRCIKQK